LTVNAAKIRNVVITRSREGNVQLARDLRDRGFNPIPVETISFLPPEDWSSIDSGLRDLGSYDWLMFTSATGVEYFARRMAELSLGVLWKGRPKVAAVGKGTAQALTKLGITVGFTPSNYLTSRLADELPAAPGERVLVLRADIADPAMPERLRKRELDVTEFAIYQTKYAEGDIEAQVEAADLIVFASPSSVEGFCRSLTQKRLTRAREVRAACIGPVTAAAAREHGFKRIVTPKSQTFDSLLDEITRLDCDV
jgi:uroporphyrinogen-III synthase